MTFEQIPQAISHLDEKVERLISLVTESTGVVNSKTEEGFLRVEEAAGILDISVQTLYIRIKSIPHYKRFGKLYFKRSELNSFLMAGK